jgi:hypothetical protein
MSPCVRAWMDSGAAAALHRHRQLLLLLALCAQRANDLHLPHLVAYSQLALAQFCSQHLVAPPHAVGVESTAADGEASLVRLESASPTLDVLYLSRQALKPAARGFERYPRTL